MARKRNPRVDRLVRSALADLIETEVADPRIAFVTLTDVDVTPDHEVATIYYSTLDPNLVSRRQRRAGGDRIPDPAEVAAGLESATPRLRTMLAGRVQLRTTPELRFRADPVVEQATRIDELLREVGGDTSDAGSRVPVDPSVYKDRPQQADANDGEHRP